MRFYYFFSRLAKNEIVQSAFLWFIIFVSFLCLNDFITSRLPEPQNKIRTAPDKFVIDVDDLNEIKNLADEQDRDYKEILDDISAKVDEIKEKAIDAEIFEEDKQRELDEQMANENYF